MQALKDNYPGNEFERLSKERFQFGDDHQHLVIEETCIPHEKVIIRAECGNKVFYQLIEQYYYLLPVM